MRRLLGTHLRSWLLRRAEDWRGSHVGSARRLALADELAVEALERRREALDGSGAHGRGGRLGGGGRGVGRRGL